MYISSHRKTSENILRRDTRRDGLRDVAEDLEAQYAAYGIKRPAGYYGFITDELAEREKSTEGLTLPEETADSPSLSM